MGRKVLQDLTGKKLYRLLVTKHLGGGLWACVCDCGSQKVVATTHLLRGNVKSCGCFNAESTSKRFRKHGYSSTKVYAVWKSIMRRCFDKTSRQYMDYGGRGIYVHDSWLDPSNFVEDMGPGYSQGLVIDRIDVDDGYTPENCRWVTRSLSSYNQRRRSDNKSSVTGVSFCKVTGKWWARISKNGVHFNLGRYNKFEDAVTARTNAELNLFCENKMKESIDGKT